MSEKFVRDVMHKGVVTCPEDVALPDAARLMALQSVRALVITDPHCGLRGILSQSDLVNAKLEFPDQDAWRNVTPALRAALAARGMTAEEFRVRVQRWLEQQAAAGAPPPP